MEGLSNQTNDIEDSLASTARSPKVVQATPTRRLKQKIRREPYQRMLLWNPRHMKGSPYLLQEQQLQEEVGENDLSEAMLTYKIFQLNWIPIEELLKEEMVPKDHKKEDHV